MSRGIDAGTASVGRRQFIAAAVAAGGFRASALGRIGAISVVDRALPLILRNGRCFRGNRWEVCDIGVDGAGALVFDAGLSGRETIDVAGRVVSPGFIDVLADNAANPDRTHPVFERFKLADGVTTALQMHGGSDDCRRDYGRFGSGAHLINCGFSTKVMAIRARIGTLAERRRAVERNLADGALGVSHSLEYQPTSFAETLEYARIAARYDRPFFLHLRYSEADRELEGVAEAVRLAEGSGARIHIDHLHSTGGTFHMEEALGLLRAARERGARITTCVYPYTFWATYLYSRRFDPGWQRRYGLTYGDLRVAGTGERLTEASFARYRNTGVLVAVPEGTMPCERTIDLAVREDFCLIASDGGIQGDRAANSHPRGAGCFATAIRYGLDHGLALERILDKMTALPRAVLHPVLARRGILETGAIADLTVFDPDAVRGRATVENPNQPSAGIALVLVNGRIAFRHGVAEAGAGLPIRFAPVEL